MVHGLQHQAVNFNALRDELKTRFTEFVTTNPKLADRELSEGVVLILETSLASTGLERRAGPESIKALSRELVEGSVRVPPQLRTSHSKSNLLVRERIDDSSGRQQNRNPDIYSR